MTTLTDNEKAKLFDDICDTIGLGSQARGSNVLVNIRNCNKFADMLHAIEREYFMTEGEPDEDYPDEEPDQVCMVSSWGSDTAEYVKEFGDILSRFKADAVMGFANTVRGAYISNDIDNHPTVYDIYRAAQNHAKDNYGIESPVWDDADAKASREDVQGWVSCSIKNGDSDMPHDNADYYLVQLGDDEGFIDEPYIDHIDTSVENGFTWFANDTERMAKAYLPIFLPKKQ